MARQLKVADPGGGQVTISLRVPAELKAQLEQEAATHDRNLSQEAERRLRRSREPDSLATDAIELLRRELNLWPASAKTLVQRVLWEVYGRDVGELGLKYCDNLAWARQGMRPARNDHDLEELESGLGEMRAARRDNEAAIARLPKRAR
jgi:signal transduction histidine kinase